MSKNDRSKTTGVASPVNTKLGGYFRLETGDGRGSWTLASTATEWDAAQSTAITLATNAGKPVRIIPVAPDGTVKPEVAVFNRGRG